MFKLLLLLLLAYFFYQLLRIVFRVHRLKRDISSAFDGATGGQRSSYSESGYSDRTADSRRKVYDSRDGEYVDFEEVPDSQPQQSSPSASSSDTDSYPPESQVVDAEFEEIP